MVAIIPFISSQQISDDNDGGDYDYGTDKPATTTRPGSRKEYPLDYFGISPPLYCAEGRCKNIKADKNAKPFPQENHSHYVYAIRRRGHYGKVDCLETISYRSSEDEDTYINTWDFFNKTMDEFTTRNFLSKWNSKTRTYEVQMDRKLRERYRERRSDVKSFMRVIVAENDYEIRYGCFMLPPPPTWESQLHPKVKCEEWWSIGGTGKKLDKERLERALKQIEEKGLETSNVQYQRDHSKC